MTRASEKTSDDKPQKTPDKSVVESSQQRSALNEVDSSFREKREALE